MNASYVDTSSPSNSTMSPFFTAVILTVVGIPLSIYYKDFGYFKMSKEVIAYKNANSLETRKSKATEILSRGNIPVIALAADTCCLETRLMKYEVPGDANFAQLIYSIRRGI